MQSSHPVKEHRLPKMGEDLGCSLRSGQHPVIPSRTMYLDDPEGNEVELICRA